MSKLSIVVFSLLGLISACVGQIIQNGQCDLNIAVHENFVASNYVGVWYDIESLPSTFQSGTCNTANYAASVNGLTIQNTQVNSEGFLESVTGTATLQAGVAATTPKFDVVISGNPSVPYWVLDTDYTTFALVYSCRNVDTLTRQVNSWKLGRAKGPLSAAATARITTKINEVPALSAAANLFVPRDHSAAACSYFIELNGLCSTTLTGATNFNATVFAGTWYESARLRQEFQTGQCNRAEYGADANGVLTVQNSQVISQALYTRSGVAFEVAGRPGVLQVNFNVNDELRSQNLVVLATDNTNYALLYSCQNVDTNRRRVSSWQLRKQLEPLGNEYINAINAAINANTDLQNQVAQYVPTNQTDASCFYYPEWDTLPATIDLPGPCPTTITGATNFNAATFVGTWYEVERFPQPTQAGQCNRATYLSGTGGGITVQNSQVTNETLSTISGTATAVANQNGVLDVTLTTSTGPVTQRLYVLATDNTNYALLYSCTNIDGNRRRVGSWKLSKQIGSLSAAANATMTTVIEATEGLNQSYYQPTSQNDAACFYYPEWDTLPATIELPGPCPTTITGLVGFNANSFLGTWYEVARYPQPTQAGQCNQATYGPIGTNGVITVQNRQVTAETLSTINGTATAVAGLTGALDVTLITSTGPVTQRLLVLDTDYENYALLYSCANIDGNRRRVGSWQLRRHLGPLNAESNVSISTTIEATQGLRDSYYQPTSQSDLSCFYYPVWDTLPATIELPGLCDTTITGATNFNAQTFVGTWYEVERFPQPTQAGQCNRATYQSGTGGGITVQNSQVTNETLSTISGTATAVANQNGVLDVTLTTSTGPVTQRLYVLATDNTNYALLYSCTNIDGNRRQVGSWKLSKQIGSLSAAANATINTVIANTQGLIQNYYQPTSQSDLSCFYYPVWDTLPATIELPGPCDTTITGATNFNAQTFLGTWYENERYPQTTQTGQCNRAVYGAGTGGAVTVQNSQVIDETLSTILGTATAVANQNGVLDVTLTTSSGPVTQRLYVLATDNTNYALLYSCANIDGNRRRVGSWKLSKQIGSLSAAANATINTVIANTQGLSQNYYQPTSQADGVCFYYPPTQTAEKVIIPGQCDTTIPGHPNINMTRFANGNWYHIQRYDQVGNRTCIGTRLSYETNDNANSVTVNSVELVGGVENRTAGTAQLTGAANGQFSLAWSGSEVNTIITVISTDYDGYAIAYTCENSGNANRQVGVWLLSRERTWPATGVAALSLLVNTRQEFTLRDGYFKVIPHNDDCPEPSSAFLFKSSIIVIFVCTILQFVW